VVSAATATQRRVLAAIASGATLKASRLYPYSPHEYKLNIPASEGTPSKEQKLGLPTVASLVTYGWLKPKPQGLLWDNIDYELTDSGRVIADEVAA
jgi:hypothetical protein